MIQRLFRQEFDTVQKDYVVVPEERDIVQLVEELEGGRLAFVMHKMSEGEDVRSSEYKSNRRAIVGYGGEGTFPFISDPTEEIRGGVGIVERKLVYSPGACVLHDMRDSYLHAYASMERHFFVTFSFMDVVGLFMKAGYPLHSVWMMRGYEHKPLIMGDPLTIEEMRLLSAEL